MKYHVWTLGCQMNEADSRHLSSQLETIGYRPTEESEEADLVVLNTCVVRQQAEDKAVGRLRNLQREKERNPQKVIALMGCMVGMREAGRLAKKFPFVDVFMPPSETKPLLDFLAERGTHDHAELSETREKAIRSAIQDEDHVLPAMQRGSSITAHVPIVLGCSHACTFCIIPYRRGSERSKSPEVLLNEVRKLADQGIKEVMLLGQIVDRYGVDFDTPYDLANLLEDVADVDGLERVRFLTSHPNYMCDRIIDVVGGHPKICPQFEIPAQAGSNSVLERMRRGYTIEEYEKVVDRIRTRVPEAAIHTDIIVGFCGETEEEFMDTYRHMERTQVDKVHLAKYSTRPKTIAARQFVDDIPAEVKEERRLRIHKLTTDILEEKMKTLLHQEVEVLVEGKDRQNERWKGRTPQNKLIFFNDDRELLGKVIQVKVNETAAYSLVGETLHQIQPV